jgi:hypothetical protein
MSQSKEMVALIRENAALCTLEAEVVIALKYIEAGQEESARMQIRKVQESLNVIEIVRHRNSQMKGMYDGENS